MAHSARPSRAWPGLVAFSLFSLLAQSASASAAANHESQIYPGPHPEAFRTLSLGVSLIGSSPTEFAVVEPRMS